MDILLWLLGVVVFFAVLLVVLLFVSFMLPIIFSLGTIFDRKVNNQ